MVTDLCHMQWIRKSLIQLLAKFHYLHKYQKLTFCSTHFFHCGLALKLWKLVTWALWSEIPSSSSVESSMLHANWLNWLCAAYLSHKKGTKRVHEKSQRNLFRMLTGHHQKTLPSNGLQHSMSIEAVQWTFHLWIPPDHHSQHLCHDDLISALVSSWWPPVGYTRTPEH